jgi:hypothetical protein
LQQRKRGEIMKNRALFAIVILVLSCQKSNINEGDEQQIAEEIQSDNSQSIDAQNNGAIEPSIPDPTETNSNQTIVTQEVSMPSVYDANGKRLGILLNGVMGAFTLLTDAKEIIILGTKSGNLIPNSSCVYSSLDCTGTCYYANNSMLNQIFGNGISKQFPFANFRDEILIVDPAKPMENVSAQSFHNIAFVDSKYEVQCQPTNITGLMTAAEPYSLSIDLPVAVPLEIK